MGLEKALAECANGHCLSEKSSSQWTLPKEESAVGWYLGPHQLIRVQCSCHFLMSLLLQWKTKSYKPCKHSKKWTSNQLLCKLFHYFSFCHITRFSFTAWGWKGIDVHLNILRSKNSTAYRMDKELFSSVASTNPPISHVWIVTAQSWSLPSSANFQSTGPNLRRQPNKEEWTTVTATSNSTLLIRRALSKSDSFPNQWLVMSSSSICISRMFYALFFFEQVPSHLRVLADVLS